MARIEGQTGELAADLGARVGGDEHGGGALLGAGPEQVGQQEERARTESRLEHRTFNWMQEWQMHVTQPLQLYEAVPAQPRSLYKIAGW